MGSYVVRPRVIGSPKVDLCERRETNSRKRVGVSNESVILYGVFHETSINSRNGRTGELSGNGF